VSALQVCGAAFDNSRSRHKRWVGSRTVKDLPYEWLRSSQHALGDLASDFHCWLIKPQAPPQFVSDQSSACDNFVGNCQPAKVQGQAGGAVRQINVASGQEVMTPPPPKSRDNMISFVEGRTHARTNARRREILPLLNIVSVGLWVEPSIGWI
jgi:hypothetical protein